MTILRVRVMWITIRYLTMNYLPWNALHLAKIFVWKFRKLSASNQRLFSMPQRWHRRQQNENGRSFPFRLDETEKVEYSEGRPFVPENFRLILASSCISIGCIGIFLESAPITYVCFSQVQISTQSPWTHPMQ